MNGLRQKGLTIVELVILIIVFGIIALLVEYYMETRAREKTVEQIETDLREIKLKLIHYKLDNYRYPSNQQGLKALVEQPSVNPPPNWHPAGYLKELPTDPWGKTYQYKHSEQSDEFVVFTLGADGAKGGDEVNADREIKSSH